MNSDLPSCKHCGGTEWYSKEVAANGVHGPELLPLGFFSWATFLIRVCGGCGHVEWFVPPRHLSKIKERFTAETPSVPSEEPEASPENEMDRSAEFKSDVAGTPWQDDPGHTNG